MLRTLITIFFTTLSLQLVAQVFPQENSSLCWRLIGFSFPPVAGTDNYKIEIAKGSYTSESAFENNILSTINTHKNEVIGEVPYFGCQYTWRVVAHITNSGKNVKSPLHNFSVNTSPDVDTNSIRLHVFKPSAQYKDAYVFVDYTRVLYDMNGKPVWFVPGTQLPQYRGITPGDMKMTSDSTITFTDAGSVYEISYDGDILWQLTVQKKRYFHHEFTRLPNGHYMGLSYKDINGDIPPLRKDTAIVDAYDSNGYYRTNLYTNLEEYDQQGNLVWSWDGMQYIHNSDMQSRRFADVPELDHDLHPNAFFFDSKNSVIYLSLRNLNRIIKIKYPEGTVLNTYGNIYQPGSWDMNNGLFSAQHCLGISHDGYLYLYNNNIAGKWHIPTITMFSEPPPGGTELKKVWEYQFPANVDSATAAKLFFTQGGSAYELPDGSFFTMMGRQCPKMSIISRDKKELWGAIPEKYNPYRHRWELVTGIYRASISSRKDLEQLIWRSEKNNPKT